MQYYGYHRTSTKEQHLERGITEIEQFCNSRNMNLARIYTDQQTGKNFDRPGYKKLKEDALRNGDCLIITEIDRLGRNKGNTMNELRYFKDKGIRIMILELPTTLTDFSDTSNEMADLMLEFINNILIELYTTLAESEMHKREKRQREGLEQLKARGEWDKMGRPRVMKQEDFNVEYERVKSGEIAPFQLMKALNIKRSTYYKYKRQYEMKKD